MKAGRNDPCPCGSGKKYKKCCIDKDQTEQAMQQVAAPPPKLPKALRTLAAPPPRPRTPEEAAIDATWGEFKAADFGQRIEIFHRTLDDPESMDRDVAFEMLTAVREQAIALNERARVGPLLAALRQRQPDLRDDDAAYYLKWQASDLVADGRFGELDEPVLAFAAIAGKQIDLFNVVLRMLAFHGQLPLLVQAVRVAWPGVNGSADVIAFGVDEFADNAVTWEMLAYLTEHPDATGTEADLLERLRVYVTLRKQAAAAFVTHVLERNARTWSLEEFDLTPKPEPNRHRDELDEVEDEWDEDEDEDEGEEDDDGEVGEDEEESEDEDEAEEAEALPPGRAALRDLGNEFIGWLHREKGLSYTLAEMGRKEVLRYLIDRAEGHLDDTRAPIARMYDKKKPKRKPINHPLSPDRERYEAYLARMMGLLAMGLADHKAAALVEVTPLWLEFLESRGLATANERQLTMNALAGLRASLANLLNDPLVDPHMVRALRTWPQ